MIQLQIFQASHFMILLIQIHHRVTSFELEHEFWEMAMIGRVAAKKALFFNFPKKLKKILSFRRPQIRKTLAVIFPTGHNFNARTLYLHVFRYITNLIFYFISGPVLLIKDSAIKSNSRLILQFAFQIQLFNQKRKRYKSCKIYSLKIVRNIQKHKLLFIERNEKCEVYISIKMKYNCKSNAIIILC